MRTSRWPYFWKQRHYASDFYVPPRHMRTVFKWLLTHIDGLLDKILHTVVIPYIGGNSSRLAACFLDLALDGADGGLRRVGIRWERQCGFVGVAGGFGRDDHCCSVRHDAFPPLSFLHIFTGFSTGKADQNIHVLSPGQCRFAFRCLWRRLSPVLRASSCYQTCWPSRLTLFFLSRSIDHFEQDSEMSRSSLRYSRSGSIMSL